MISQDSFEKTLTCLQEIVFQLKEINAVYLFGSVARGDYSIRHSDLDLFIFLKHERNKKIEEKISRLLIPVGLQFGVKIHIEFQGKTIQKEDHSLLRKIIEEGKPIYAAGNFIIDGMQLGLRQFIIYSYSLKNSKQKSYFSKVLHGRKSWYYNHGKKTVKEYNGIIDTVSIIDIGKGALMVAKERQKDIILVFERFGVLYTIKRIVYG